MHAVSTLVEVRVDTYVATNAATYICIRTSVETDSLHTLQLNS